MFEVLKPGLETTVQSLPGRIGFLERGFPCSGPADAWSFRLSNLLVGNHRDAPALEWQFVGPTIRFLVDVRIALSGADVVAKLDDVVVPLWQTLPVRAGQTLVCAGAKTGARGYIAISGGVVSPTILGSSATFHMAGIGGPSVGALKKGDTVAIGAKGDDTPLSANASLCYTVPQAARPPIDAADRDRSDDRIAALLGPNDAWLDAAGIARFYDSDWTVLPQSNRTGIRLKGPAFTFAPCAYDKRPEHGTDPSNILDHGYPLGGISIAGQTPIVFVQDSPTAGGFIVPFTVPKADLWRLGQARPNETIRFKQVSLAEAQSARRKIDALCQPEALRAVATSECDF
ncbi:hypothetical protein WM40_19845 [Robbsia andropogonis]|uniref:Carboxyltransferase domain-containing protein n=1 Tax=Robbsia andropogonis TaxID=28092 RepID=A0A0F5JWE9_9BURK|nr:biotin-dependent carboxyltransferase family protein [Robbsia andropogonis]KKB62025.1 hypothetical protein WM40_19845 [Robbsia andropogonis]MCP1119415.1 biotin-dependent carboxyltransferase family protein [Robbsia andropogonis]MCP1129398.1 biotin-dependent carboxyltransferase family protein [Robbsia andropogonis]